VYKNYYGNTLITHQGYSGFSGGVMGIIPELRITYVQLYNVAWIPPYIAHTAFVSLMGKNPEEVMPFYIRRKLYTSLAGSYDSFKQIAKIKIENRGGMLYLIDKNWMDPWIFPLIPKDLSNPNSLNFYTITSTGTMDIYFVKLEDKSIICQYERRIFHKKIKSL
jgi:hypothetical protein